MARRANVNWAISNTEEEVPGIGHAQLAVLMDIRDELQKLNAVFACFNFTNMPAILRQIRKNTANLQKVKRK